MKTPFKTGHRFRVLLPLILTGMQLGLLAASLIVHREPWVLPDPPESRRQAQADCSGEDCAVSFSLPPEPRFGRILMMAIVLNLPAVYLGVVLHIVAVLIHFPRTPGEPTLLAFSALFVPVIWYRVGRWMDDLAMGGIAGGTAQFTAKAVWTSLTRVLAWLLFGISLLGLLFEFHRESNATKFMAVTVILWTGAYLAGGLLGDRQRKSRLRTSAGGLPANRKVHH